MKAVIVSLFLAGWVAVAAHADDLRLQDNAPQRYVVVKGDTLWGISAHFLKDPWKWPQIWGMNREEIHNPHWIYPGNVIVLHWVNGQPRLSLEQSPDAVPTVHLSPSVRGESLDDNGGIPPLPASAIHAFASQPVVMDEAEMHDLPRIVEFESAHIDVGAGDEVFATGEGEARSRWKIVTPGAPIIDPADAKGKRVLGYGADYLGEGRTVTPGQPQRVLIVSSAKEVEDGDRLVPWPARETYTFNYVPHAPDQKIDGLIVSTIGVMSEAGRFNSIVINKGRADGLEQGDVLAIYRHGPGAVAGMTMPETRSALCMVYRVYDKLAYALIMDSTHSVSALDIVRNP